MSCVHFTPAQGRSRGRAPLFLIQEYPRLPGFPSDVYGIMTQRSDSARPRPYAELDQALHTLGGGGGGVMYSWLYPGSSTIIMYYSLVVSNRANIMVT